MVEKLKQEMLADSDEFKDFALRTAEAAQGAAGAEDTTGRARACEPLQAGRARPDELAQDEQRHQAR